jgi:hypothetical protein
MAKDPQLGGQANQAAGPSEGASRPQEATDAAKLA